MCAKTSKYNFPLLNVDNLRLLAYRDLLPRLANNAAHNKPLEVLGYPIVGALQPSNVTQPQLFSSVCVCVHRPFFSPLPPQVIPTITDTQKIRNY